MAKRYRELEAAIDAVAASYDAAWPINNLESAALPNRRKVVAGLQELVPSLFMGFYATRDLDRDNLRHGIAECMYRAHDLLVQEIERALTYQHWYGFCDDCPPPGSGETVVLELFRKLPEIRRILHTDLQAAFEGDPAAQSIEEIVFSYPSVTAIVTYRIAHQLWESRVPMIPRILSEHAHCETGIDIHPGAQIGESFFIDHGTGVV
ncbi:MAG: serine acetyltransferase, partial [Myxococcota bacterium]